MNNLEIKSIVEMALRNELEKIYLPAMFLIICFLMFIFSHYIRTYLSKKGENRAIKEDLKRITSHIERQTAATELIKSRILYSNWKNQENNSVLRRKLEELTNAAFSLRKNARDDIEKLLQSDDQACVKFFDYEPDELLKIEVITKLYFPELTTKTITLNISFRKLQQKITELNEQKRTIFKNQTTDPVKYTNMQTGLNNDIPQLYQEFLSNIEFLGNESHQLLIKLMASESLSPGSEPN